MQISQEFGEDGKNLSTIKHLCLSYFEKSHFFHFNYLMGIFTEGEYQHNQAKRTKFRANRWVLVSFFTDSESESHFFIFDVNLQTQENIYEKKIFFKFCSKKIFKILCSKKNFKILCSKILKIFCSKIVLIWPKKNFDNFFSPKWHCS